MAVTVEANVPLIELIRDRKVQDPPGISYHIADSAHLHLAPHTPLPPDIYQAFLLDTTWPAMLLILPFTLLLGAGMAALGSTLGDTWYWRTS